MLVEMLLVASVVVYVVAMAIFYRGGFLQSLFGIGVGIVLIYAACYLHGILPGMGPFVNC